MKNIRENEQIEKVSEILGWYGAVAVIVAFGLLTADIIKSDDMVYLLLNLTGSAGLMFDAYMDKNTQPVFTNLIWGAISLYGFIQIFI